MKTIKKIGVLSLAKIQALITGAMYLLVSLVINIIGAKKPEAVAGYGIPPGIIGVIVVVVSGIVMGFIAGIVIAWLYNLIAPKVGGIQIEIT